MARWDHARHDGILIFFLVRPLLIGRLAVAWKKRGSGAWWPDSPAATPGGVPAPMVPPLRTSVRILWSKKTPAMILDTSWGSEHRSACLVAALCLQGVTGKTLPLGM